MFLTDIRWAKQQDIYNIVFEFNGKPTYKVFTLDKPDRIVIDIDKVIWNVKKYHIPKDILTNIRHSIRQNQHRIVLDLRQKLSLENQQVIYKNGLYKILLKLKPVIPVSKNESMKAISNIKQKKDILSRKPVIIIDPGHGGEDSGAISRYLKIYEKNITLAYALELKRILDKSNKYKVILTRSSDKFLTLNQRVAIAKKYKGDLFISLHADSHPNPNTRGLSVYTVAERASDQEAAYLAKQFDLSDEHFSKKHQTRDKEVEFILADLIKRETRNVAAQFAETAIYELMREIKLLRNTHRYAGFQVLKAGSVPSILIELGYLSNREEEILLRSHKYRYKLMNALAKTIEKHFKHHKIY